MIDFRTAKVASNKSLLKLIKTIGSERFVNSLIELINENGLNFYQREILSDACGRAVENSIDNIATMFNKYIRLHRDAILQLLLQKTGLKQPPLLGKKCCGM